MIQARLEERAKKFQNPIDVDDFKRRREDDAIELRKQRRYEYSSKKRALIHPPATMAFDSSAEFPAEVVHPRLMELAPRLLDTNVTAEERTEIVLRLVLEAKDGDVYPAVETLKKAISSKEDSPLEHVARDEVVKRLVELLDCNKEEIVHEALWCLANLASGTSEVVNRVVRHGCLHPVHTLLLHPNPDISDLSVWTLSNIIGDSPVLRDHVISSGFLIPIFSLLSAPERLTYARTENLLWLVTNVLNGYPTYSDPAPVDYALTVVPWALRSEHERIVSQGCWILAYISDGGDFSRIDKILRLTAFPALLTMMVAPSESISRPALRSIGNLLTGEDAQTQQLLDAGVLDVLHTLITKGSKFARKDAAWCLSNITAGVREHVLAVFRHKVMGELVKAMGEVDLEMRKEAVWAVANALGSMEEREKQEVVDMGAMESLVESLRYPDARLLLISLECLHNLLLSTSPSSFPPCSSPFLPHFEQIGGLEALEHLQSHPNLTVYDHAVAVLDRFFTVEEVQRGPEEAIVIDQYQFS